MRTRNMPEKIVSILDIDPEKEVLVIQLESLEQVVGVGGGYKTDKLHLNSVTVEVFKEKSMSWLVTLGSAIDNEATTLGWDRNGYLVAIGNGVAISAETFFQSLSKITPMLDEDAQIDEIELMITLDNYAEISPEFMKDFSFLEKIVEQPDQSGKLN